MKSFIYKYVTNWALNLSRSVKRALALFLDIILCVFAFWLALSLRLEKLVSLDLHHLAPLLLAIGIIIPIFISCGLYKTILRYSSTQTMGVLAKAIFFYALIYSIIILIIGFQGVPRSIGILQPILMFMLILASRWIIKNWLREYFSKTIPNNVKKNIIIYGAGNAGQQLASSLLDNQAFKLITFVDDNENLWGGTINGHPVLSPKKIKQMLDIKNVKELWLAIPSATDNTRKQLINNLRKFPMHVRTLPNFSDLLSNKIRIGDVRELDINELLNRTVVKPNFTLLQKCILGKTVLVTGAGGSIGSELCRQVLNQKPNCILLIDNSEVALYNIHKELESIKKQQNIYDKNHITLIPLLINIQDKLKLIQVFEKWRPQTVYHAAAYKHVPMVEYNVVAGISNNVIGTLTCATVAINYEAEHFVLVSTDKAVRPTNIMGASKRLAEIVLQSLCNDKNKMKTSLSMVRFGNVLGSSGSVVPLFRKQIETGGPVTLTHEKITRYFMTVQEASQLVIQAGAMAEGGEVFVLDMGKPIRIKDLARNMIQASGLVVKDKKTPWGDIEIQISGIRPGEKLYEELLIGENQEKTQHPLILRAHETFMKRKDFDIHIKKLTKAMEKNNIKEIRKILVSAVPGFIPNIDIVDWIDKNTY